MQERVEQEFKWKQKYRSASLALVPKKPGLYAYGKTDKVFGLEKKRNIVYVGLTDDLYRRLSEHAPSKEENSELRKYLHEEKNVICWYCILENLSKKEIRDIERLMIQKLKPRFCTQHNRKQPR